MADRREMERQSLGFISPASKRRTKVKTERERERARERKRVERKSFKQFLFGNLQYTFTLWLLSGALFHRCGSWIVCRVCKMCTVLFLHRRRYCCKSRRRTIVAPSIAWVSYLSKRIDETESVQLCTRLTRFLCGCCR